ncbi:MAG: amino acid permease [Planctomycetes bacterium]|nr:amino acid permease [Planctomycetota bacterium]
MPRKLSLFDATMMVMGGIIGMGLFFRPAAVAAELPSGPAILLVWALGGLVAMCGALTFAELGGTFPKEGGWYVFLREAFGRFPAFLFAWVVLFAISTGSMAVVLGFCVDRLHELFPDLIQPAASAGGRAVGGLIIAAITGISMFGVKVGARFQNGCMLVKLLAIAALVVGALALAGSGVASAPPAPKSGSLAGGLAPALLAVFFTYGGWQMVCYIAPQVRDPERNLPRAIVLGVLGVVAVYLAANIGYLHVLGVAGLAGNEGFATQIAVQVFGPSGSRVLIAAMAVSAIGLYTVNVIATPWLYVAMAREGLFFKRFERLHPKTGAPILALCLQALLTFGYLSWKDASTLADSVVFSEWIFHALVALALILLRWRRPALPRPFKSPLYPLAPLVYLAIALYVLVGNLTDLTRVSQAAAVLAVGALIFPLWRPRST